MRMKVKFGAIVPLAVSLSISLPVAVHAVHRSQLALLLVEIIKCVFFLLLIWKVAIDYQELHWNPEVYRSVCTLFLAPLCLISMMHDSLALGLR